MRALHKSVYASELGYATLMLVARQSLPEFVQFFCKEKQDETRRVKPAAPGLSCHCIQSPVIRSPTAVSRLLVAPGAAVSAVPPDPERSHHQQQLAIPRHSSHEVRLKRLEVGLAQPRSGHFQQYFPVVGNSVSEEISVKRWR